uniref:Uncharacterized protein n=1 Tax=Anopheles atroparvus TaxID=41427 RepID=A0AAG5DSY7_ANOAO
MGHIFSFIATDSLGISFQDSANQMCLHCAYSDTIWQFTPWNSTSYWRSIWTSGRQQVIFGVPTQPRRDSEHFVRDPVLHPVRLN